MKGNDLLEHLLEFEQPHDLTVELPIDEVE